MGAACDFLAFSTGGPGAEEARDRLAAPPASKSPRGKAPRAFRLEAPTPTENEVQATAHRWLEADRRVAWVVRTNNGAAYDASGNFFRFVRTATGKGVPGWVDLVGQTAWGAFLAIEAKADRSGWRTPAWFDSHIDLPDMELGKEALRIVNQERFMRTVRAGGGAAGPVWGISVGDQLEAILVEGFERWCEAAARWTHERDEAGR